MATIAGVIYGIYHKWQFSKSRMHLHIQEFLKREDERLIPARKQLDAIVTRPGPAREFASAIFSIQKLAPALKRMQWGRIEQADGGLDTELSNRDSNDALQRRPQGSLDAPAERLCGKLQGSLGASPPRGPAERRVPSTPPPRGPAGNCALSRMRAPF
jgi:hypothetical protein